MSLTEYFPRIIALDLDGVFANFEKAAHQVWGDDSFKRNPTGFWNHIGKNVDHFFESFEIIPDSKRILDAARQYEECQTFILTALPIPRNKLATAKQDKIEWVKKNLDPNIHVETIIGGKNKYKYCNSPTDILIDDLPRNVDAWINAGGIGILHKDIDDTIEQLHEALSSTL